MDKKTVFVKTDIGDSEVNGQSDLLFGDNKRILSLVDDESTVGEITKRAPPSLRESMNEVLQELLDGGFIKDIREPAKAPKNPVLKMSTPAYKMTTPIVTSAPQAPPVAEVKAFTVSEVPKNTASQIQQNSDLDFSFITSAPAQSQSSTPIQEGATREKIQEESIAKAKKDAEYLQAKQLAQSQAIEEAVKQKAYEEAKVKAQIEAAAHVKKEAESIARARQEAARLQAEQVAKQKAYEEAKLKAQIEVAARARIEAETRVRREADEARLKAEQAALRARTEAEATKARIEAEVRARIEAEARVKQEAEAIRRKAEMEAEKLRKELEAARIKAETELKIRLEAEARAKAEIEARVKREAEAERLRVEKERAEFEIARVKAEAEIRIREEAELLVRMEIEARMRADALAKLEAESKLTRDILSGGVSKPVSPKDIGGSTDQIRQSFVESFVQKKKKSDVTTGSFKLEKFSLIDTGKIAAYTGEIIKPEALPGAGSRVKEAIAERARKEEEARRLKEYQEAELLKAGQSEAGRVRMQQDIAAENARAEQESIRLKAEHEAYRLKIQQDEERAKAEAEAEVLTVHQTRQWEEAQRRAAAHAEHERVLAKQIAEAETKSWQKAARKAHKPLPIGKVFAGLFVFALISIAGLPYFWPTDEYIAPLEAEISAQIKQPVRIKKINFTLLPIPKLELHTVAVGKSDDLKIGDIEMNFDISALFASTKSISKLELRTVTMSGPALDKVMFWIQSAGGIEKYPVARIELNGVRINTDEMTLPVLNGRVDFDPQGRFTKADLKSADGKLGIEFQLQQNYLKLEASLQESNLPIFPSIKFNDLSFIALVTNGEVVFSDIFAHIHGGTITGKGRLNWGNGWKIQGQVNAKNIDLKRMFPGTILSGEILGDMNISMAGAALSQLDKDPRIEGSFEAKNGVINKIDIETVARFGARPGVAGHTNFTEFAGTIRADKNGPRIFVSKLASAAANTTGLIDVDLKQQFSGKLQVEIKGPGEGTYPLQLSGSIMEPVVKSGR
jgi:hypothetical protein